MNCFELFAGCGGFSEGFSSKDYRMVFSIDFHRASCETLKYRLFSKSIIRLEKV